MLKSIFILIFILILSCTTAYGTLKIYLVRHAKVDMNKPGWRTSKNAAEYKDEYNSALVEPFNPEEVLQKIENHAFIDTIFCSPQPRAIETATVLFADRAILQIDSALIELDYPVIQVPVLQLPVKGWLFVSRITWMVGINSGDKSAYRQRIEELEVFLQELMNYAHRNGHAIVVAHGIVNLELVRILKNNGWQFCDNGRGGYRNLSVNCLELL